jgi:hypothetical protein
VVWGLLVCGSYVMDNMDESQHLMKTKNSLRPCDVGVWDKCALCPRPCQGVTHIVVL